MSPCPPIGRSLTTNIKQKLFEMIYLMNAIHRNRTPNKSQWTITPEEELRTFRICEANRWYSGNVGWGLHLNGNRPLWLGLTRDHKQPTFIAKFVGDASGTWHGYPADHTSNIRDIPFERVLLSWLTRSLFSKAKIRKIARGQKCNL